MMSDLQIWKDFFSSNVKGNQDLVQGYIRFIEICKDKNIPPVFEERHLSYLIGIDFRTLVFYLTNSPKRYRTFTIPKRRGGVRVINTPTPGLLLIQKWVLQNVLYKIPVSDFAHGGVPGRSIITNAKPHLGAKTILRIDLRDFFNNIPIAMGIKIFETIGYSPHLSRSLALLCFQDGRLPQGAATSSALANLAAISLDARLSGLATELGLTYTRYVDDLTFSGQSIGVKTIAIIENIIKQCDFFVNTEKTQLVRGSSPKFVTGLSVGGPSLRVPRSFRRDLKNEAFQIIKRGVVNHLNATERRDPLIIEKILGKLAFWMHVEPESQSARQLFVSLLDLRRSFTTEFSLPNPKRIAPITPWPPIQIEPEWPNFELKSD